MSLNRLLKRSGPADPSGGAVTPPVATMSSNVSEATTAAAPKGGKSPEDIIKGEVMNIYNKCKGFIVCDFVAYNLIQNIYYTCQNVLC